MRFAYPPYVLLICKIKGYRVLVQTHRLLLDTHVFLWWRGKDRRLRNPARAAIAEAELVMVSAASVWEAGIKAQIGKLDLPDSFETGVL